MHLQRQDLINQIQSYRNSRVIVYVTGDRPNMETHIHPEIIPFLADHLNHMPWNNDRISLYLYSRGGATLAGWNIVNLIRMFCDNFEVIIPSFAHSTATLIAIGANKIIMTKQATLGPVDPSVNTPYNPPVPNGPPGSTLPVSVEDVAKYIELAKSESSQIDLTQVFLKLAAQVHPLALGAVNRSRTQIKMLAEKLLKHHMDQDDDIKKVIEFLCSESGSHDYTINRREAEALHLPVEKPDEKLYDLINKLFVNITKELELREMFAPQVNVSTSDSMEYNCPRALLESNFGSHRFVSKGVFYKQQLPDGMMVYNDQRMFEGWIFTEHDLLNIGE